SARGCHFWRLEYGGRAPHLCRYRLLLPRKPPDDPRTRLVRCCVCAISSAGGMGSTALYASGPRSRRCHVARHALSAERTPPCRSSTWVRLIAEQLVE